MNVTSFLLPSDIIYLTLGGWIQIFGLLYKKILNLAPASLLATQLASANNIDLFSVWLWINMHMSTRLTLVNLIIYTVDKQYKNRRHIGLNA